MILKIIIAALIISAVWIVYKYKLTHATSVIVFILFAVALFLNHVR